MISRQKFAELALRNFAPACLSAASWTARISISIRVIAPSIRKIIVALVRQFRHAEQRLIQKSGAPGLNRMPMGKHGCKKARPPISQLRGGREPAFVPAKTERIGAAAITERRFPPESRETERIGDLTRSSCDRSGCSSAAQFKAAAITLWLTPHKTDRENAGEVRGRLPLFRPNNYVGAGWALVCVRIGVCKSAILLTGLSF